jgi:nitroreductase
VEYLAAALRGGYAKLLKLWGNVLGRGIIRWKRGEEMTEALRSHVIPIIREDNAWFERNGMDRYLYSAPVVMLFHSSRWEAAHQETLLVAATYAMLSAHALGLGATMLSIVPPLFNNMGEEVRPHFGIPEENRVVIALVLGHPKYKFRRVLRRPLKSVRYVPKV